MQTTASCRLVPHGFLSVIFSLIVYRSEGSGGGTHTLPQLVILGLSLSLDHFLFLRLRFTAFVGHLDLDSSIDTWNQGLSGKTKPIPLDSPSPSQLFID